MKILYHHRTQGRGVERVHIMGIVDAWKKAGHDVEIVSPPHVSLAESDGVGSAPRGTLASLSRRAPQVIFEIMELFYNLWGVKTISKEVRNRRPQLIYERYAFLCFAGTLSAAIHKVPFFLEVNFTTGTPLVRQRTILIRPLDRLIERFVFRRATGIIVVSSYLKSQLVEAGIPQERIVVVPNAADPAKFYPSDADPELVKELGIEGKKTVGFIGFFYKWHGIDLLLDAFKVVVKERDDVVCLLVGEGPMLPMVRERAAQDVLTNRVLTVGKVAHAAIPRYVSLFDIAVMPHSNVYGSPMKIPEYMAAGKAVVAPRLGPVEDIIHDRETGVLFVPQQVDDLAEKVLTLLNADEYRKGIAEAARAGVLKEHNWDSRARTILEYYVAATAGGEA